MVYFKKYYKSLVEYYPKFYSIYWRSRSLLLMKLNDIRYYYIVDDDRNQALRALSFRKELGIDGYEDDTINDISVLEMLISLCFDIENEIMSGFLYQEDYGPSIYFQDMLEELGLLEFQNSNFFPEMMDAIDLSVQRFLDRSYDRDGSGGIFVVRNPKIDMRKEPLWKQANLYFGEKLEIIGKM